MSNKPSYLDFDRSVYQWKPGVDYRRHPQLYYVGKGEQGVLICEPYKSEIGKFWRFSSKELAEQSSAAIFSMFMQYLANDDFVGADMARKYLQMGYTRARRYANYKGGRKYDKDQNYRPLERGTGDPEKADSAAIFYQAWKLAESNEQYAALKNQWKRERG